MENRRVSLKKAVPGLFQTAVELERQTDKYAASSGIAEGFAHLLRLRASQLNGCAYCIRMHSRDALSSGETPDRVSVLPAWRETGYFSVKERAALALIEAVTLIADGQVPDSIYEQAAQVLSDEEIAAVEWIAIMINVWNRISISNRTPVKP